MDYAKTLVLIVALFVLLAQTTAVRTPQARVSLICKTTTNPSLCSRTILPKVGAKFNIYQALEIEVNKTQKKVLEIALSLTSLDNGQITRSDNVTEMQQYFATLKRCKPLYKNATNSIAKSVKLVSQRNTVEARVNLRAVMSNNKACKDGFGGRVSPFEATSQEVFDLSSNCLDIIKAIEERGIRRKAKN